MDNYNIEDPDGEPLEEHRGQESDDVSKMPIFIKFAILVSLFIPENRGSRKGNLDPPEGGKSHPNRRGRNPTNHFLVFNISVLRLPVLL